MVKILKEYLTIAKDKLFEVIEDNPKLSSLFFLLLGVYLG